MSQPPKRSKLGHIRKTIFGYKETSLLSLAANTWIIFNHIENPILNNRILFSSLSASFSLTVLNVLCQFWPCFCIISTPYESNEM